MSFLPGMPDPFNGFKTSGQIQEEAIQAQQSAADRSVSLQEKMWQTQQDNMKPWLTAGTGAVNQLGTGLQPGGQFATAPTFNFDPNSVDVTKDPGYQFRLKQGMDAINASGAAAGNLGSGAQGVALQNYGQGLASTEYQNAYQRAYQNALDTYNSNLNAQNTVYNRLAGLAGTGQTAVAQIGSAGQGYANNVGSLLTNAASNKSNLLMQGLQNSQQQWGNLSNQIMGGVGAYNQNQMYQQYLNSNAGSLYGGQWQGDGATSGYYDASGGQNFGNMDTVDLSSYS